MGWWGRITETLSDLVQGRHRMLPIFGTMQSVYLARVYYLAAELNLADRLRQQPMTALQLADATGTQVAMLSRVLRVLAAVKVFREDRHGVFHLRWRARPLLSDDSASLHDWLLLIGRREIWQGLAMALESLRTGKSGFELAHGANYYDYLPQHPELREAFIRSMSKWTDWQARHVVRAYDFGRFGTVVDVGGGRGSLLLEILAAHPRTRAVLFDQAETIEQARLRLASSGYADRCRMVSGSFLESVPDGGDAYVVKHVLRDWDDDRARTILCNCHRAMPPRGVLLVIEAAVDPRNGKDRLIKLLDFEGGTLLPGRLRTYAEMRQLLDQAGFRLVKIHPSGVVDSLVFEAQKRDGCPAADGGGALRSRNGADA